MSAAIGQIFEPPPDGVSAQEWVRGVTTPGTAVGPRRAKRPAVATVCAAAVDPLEIAAALEAAGMSHHVVVEETGHRDVFALAADLWERVPFREVEMVEPPSWRRGNASDLGRGALYAAPALLIHALSSAANVRIAWWGLPLAMTWGWAMGQLTAFGGYTMRGRGDRTGEARLVSMLLMIGVLTTAGLALAAEHYFGGGRDSVILATCVTTYMVASAVLLLHENERLGAILLLPGAAVGAAVLVAGDSIPAWLVIGAVGSSALATLAAACRHLGRPWVGPAVLGPADLSLAFRHCLHGVLCGLALCVIVLLGIERFDVSQHSALVAAPLLVTLGLMEWRLRTFRADVETLSRELETIGEFAWEALSIFLRGFAVYATGLVVTSIVVAIVLQTNNTPIPVMVLLGAAGLGSVYYVDLTLTSLGRLDLVLSAWLKGLSCGVYAFVLLAIVDVELTTALWWSAHLTIWATLVALLIDAASVVSAPCSH